MAIQLRIHLFLQLVPLFVISLFFLRLVFWRNWRSRNLPPGPLAWPIVGNILQLRFAKGTFESSVKRFRERYGPIFTLWLGSRPLLMVTSREIAHEALIQKGSVFADRPPSPGARQIFTSAQHSINSAAYGPLWQSLRRNLVSKTLSPSAMKAFGGLREWCIGRLVETLRNEAAQNGGVVNVTEPFRTTVLRILLCMCFGSKPNDETVISVQSLLREILMSGGGLNENFAFPGVFFLRRRARMVELRRKQREVLLPLINKHRNAPPPAGASYLHALLALTVDGGRNLHEDELVTLCSEMFTAGTGSVSASLQWLMANVVNRQDVQARLYDEIVGSTGGSKSVEEDDLQRMPYLEAVVKENLRRHPPVPFTLTHAVTRPCNLAGYDVPADALVSFHVAGIGMDPKYWQNPSEFRPERFADEGVEVDLKGTKEIKMMPFGVGRRMCPALEMVMLHNNLILARLVQEFTWECKPGKTVDLSHIYGIITVMKYPLQAIIKDRSKP